MEWVEVTGRTVEEAREQALDLLGAAEEDTEVEVLAEPKMGLFGRLREEARVRARLLPAVPRSKDDSARRRRGGRGPERPGRAGDTGPERPGRAGDTGPERPGRAGDTGPERPGRAGDTGPERPGRAGRTAPERSEGAGDPAPGGGVRPEEIVPQPVSARAGRATVAVADDEQKDEANVERTMTADPRTADPRTADPRTADPRTADPRTADPRTADPRTAHSRTADSRSDDRPEVPVAEQAEVAKRFVEGLLETMGIEGSSTTVVEIDEDTAEVQVTGTDLGLLIGPKGATLLALQDLARTVVQRKTGARTGRLLLDVAGYRAKRKEALERFTEKVAQQVVVSGEPAALEPMSSADRKIIHDTANAIDGVTTSSEGEDPRRCVVVHPA